MQILIAEDDVITRRTLEALLVKWGYAVIVVRDGVEAWRILLNLITGLSDVACPLPLKTRLDVASRCGESYVNDRSIFQNGIPGPHANPCFHGLVLSQKCFVGVDSR